MRIISPADVAQVEAWAADGFPDHGDGSHVVVRARGNHLHIEERRPRSAGGVATRTLIRLRFVDKSDTWVVHRAASGGRWLPDRGVEGSLSDVLAAIDLRGSPPPSGQRPRRQSR